MLSIFRLFKQSALIVFFLLPFSLRAELTTTHTFVFTSELRHGTGLQPSDCWSYTPPLKGQLKITHVSGRWGYQNGTGWGSRDICLWYGAEWPWSRPYLNGGIEATGWVKTIAVEKSVTINMGLETLDENYAREQNPGGSVTISFELIPDDPSALEWVCTVNIVPDAGAGSCSGKGTYKDKSNVTCTAVPEGNFKFGMIEVYMNGAITQYWHPSITFEITGDATVTASFVEDENSNENLKIQLEELKQQIADLIAALQSSLAQLITLVQCIDNDCHEIKDSCADIAGNTASIDGKMDTVNESLQSLLDAVNAIKDNLNSTPPSGGVGIQVPVVKALEINKEISDAENINVATTGINVPQLQITKTMIDEVVASLGDHESKVFKLEVDLNDLSFNGNLFSVDEAKSLNLDFSKEPYMSWRLLVRGVMEIVCAIGVASSFFLAVVSTIKTV